MATKKGKLKQNLNGIQSMTGYGKDVEKFPEGKIIVEIKTWNYKALSIVNAIFIQNFSWEQKIEKIIGNKISRGKVFIKIYKENNKKETKKNIKINKDLLKEYIKNIKTIKKDFKIQGEININNIIKLPGIIENTENNNEEKLWKYVNIAVEKAVTSLIAYRKNEGSQLIKDLEKRLKIIQKNILLINKFQEKNIASYKDKILKSICEIKQGEIDNGKIETEIISFIKNCDISEELTRINGHIKVFNDSITNVKSDIGKKLDFIAQEMQREINTIAAKSDSFDISSIVVEVKTQIEKIREQVKNIE